MIKKYNMILSRKIALTQDPKKAVAKMKLMKRT
jgi:hypothetical protein